MPTEMPNRHTVQLDPRAAILAALVGIVGIVSISPLDAARLAIIVLLVVCASMILSPSPRSTFLRSLVAIPFAIGIAAFSPLRLVATWNAEGVRAAYAAGWWHAVSLVVVAWLCAYIALTLTSHLGTERLLTGLTALKVPPVLIMLFSFIARYMRVLGDRIVTMTRAIDARAPHLRRLEKAHLYGHLGGSLMLRTHDAGERIHQAMLARGFDGTLPTPPLPAFHALDLMAPLVALLTVVAIRVM